MTDQKQTDDLPAYTVYCEIIDTGSGETQRVNNSFFREDELQHACNDAYAKGFGYPIVIKRPFDPELDMEYFKGWPVTKPKTEVFDPAEEEQEETS